MHEGVGDGKNFISGIAEHLRRLGWGLNLQNLRMAFGISPGMDGYTKLRISKAY
jgi:hypothetical protein